MGGICAAGASGAAGSVPRRGLMVSAWSEEPGAPCGVAQGGCHTPTAPWGPQKPLVRPAAAGRDPGEAAPLARWVVWGQGQEQGVPPAPGLGRSRDPSPGKLVPVSPSLLALSLLIPTSPSLLAPGLSQALPAPVPGNCQHVDPPVSQEPVTSHPGSGGPFPPQNIFFSGDVPSNGTRSPTGFLQAPHSPLPPLPPAGIECPRGARNLPGLVQEGEPFSEEATHFTKELVLQREVGDAQRRGGRGAAARRRGAGAGGVGDARGARISPKGCEPRKSC